MNKWAWSTKGAAWIAIAAVSMTMLAACGADKTDSGDKKGTEPAAQPKVEEKKPIELVFYSSSGDFDEPAFMETFGNKIKAKFPYITPKFIPYNATNRMDKMVASGETIDIVYYSIGASTELLEYKLYQDISDLIAKNKYDLNRLEPAVLDAQKKLAGGAIYGLPVFNNTMSLFYNKDLFDKFGVKYPKDGMTWEELADLAKSLSRTDGGVSYKGLTMSPTAAMVLNQAGIHYIDPVTNKSTFTTDAFKKQFELLTSFAKIPGNGLDAKTVPLAAQIALFNKDKLAAMHLHFSVYGLTQFKDTLNWDVASYPVMKDKPGVGAQPYPTYFYITKNSKLRDDAFDVIAYLSSNEFQEHLAKRGMLPILKDRDAIMKQFGSEVAYLKNKNINALLPKTYTPSGYASANQLIAQNIVVAKFQAAYSAVALGEKDVNTALREAEEASNKEIDALLATKK
ncbi:ABC transporter substrate-binding protein [Paenibacillus ginsengarvi]|uniref:Extracellular solute-binding protein n=1 Tax=Paenibacillus ginsengarvi TaxID=400777 RepID=A0A3B0CFT2_9BACL|nr:extracellular solute-binding protein [Paenibacillus ginsengarvi]RKN83778.1 extracellular solute-binding protein [Paenibacillus ginsengarvi]